MWKTTTKSGQSLPKDNHHFYTTIESLKKYKNGETVTLNEVVCQSGTHKLLNLNERDYHKIVLCPDNEDVFKSTFVRYFRLDGKPEERRLDRLQNDGYDKPDMAHADCISYDNDVKPFIMGTTFFLSGCVTDWPSDNSSVYTRVDEPMLERLGMNANYIRADATRLKFSSGEKEIHFLLSDILKKSVSLPCNTEDEDKGESFDFQSPATGKSANSGIHTVKKAHEGESNLNVETQLSQLSQDTNEDDPCDTHLGEDKHSEESLVSIDTNEQIINDQRAVERDSTAEQSQIRDDHSNDDHTFDESEPEDNVTNVLSETTAIEVADSTASTASTEQPVQPCPFCSNVITDKEAVTLTERGLGSIKEAGKKRKDNLLFFIGQKVHKTCRQKYINPNYIASAMKKSLKRERSESPNLRSQHTPFSFQTQCFYCAQTVKHNDPNVYNCRTLGLKQKVMDKCDSRNDDWSNEIKVRLSGIIDLHAADAVYHNQCNKNFMANKNIPSSYVTVEQDAKKGKGRPVDPDQLQAFLDVAKYLEENDDEQVTVNDWYIVPDFGHGN